MRRVAAKLGFWPSGGRDRGVRAVPLLLRGADLVALGHGPLPRRLSARAARLSNYVAVFERQPFGRNILNSVARRRRGRGALALPRRHGRLRVRARRVPRPHAAPPDDPGVSMFPQVAVLSGMFELIRRSRALQHAAGLVLANLMLTLPFTVWVLTTFMRELPREIEEAALVDGATPWITVRRVFLPLMAPAAGDDRPARLHRRLERVPVRADLHAHRTSSARCRWRSR